MKTTRTLLIIPCLVALTLTSCIVPPNPFAVIFPSVGVGYVNQPPYGYGGNSYYYNGRYYSGGRYENGTYYYSGRRYSDRYYHNGHYYYGGRYYGTRYDNPSNRYY